MRRGKQALALLILPAQTVVACASVAPNGAPPGTGTPAVMMTANVAPLAVDLRGVPLNPGLRWVNVSSGAPVPRRMAMLVPDDIDRAGPRPLVIFLHGGAGGGKLPERLECLVAPAFARISPLVVAPEAAGGDWWEEAETAYVLGLADAAVRDWRAVDARRLVIMGHSNGGIGAWFFARLYPERFSAAIPMSANHAIIGESPLPIHVIHGSNDNLFDVEKVRERVQALAQRGVNVSLDVKEGGQHGDPCGYVRELEAAALWLETTVWKAPAPK